MRKSWKLAETDPVQVSNLSEELDLPNAICKVLLQRDLNSKEKIANFFNPSLSQLHSPFLMKDMEIATSRIIHAIENKEKILLYGDYDVDGTCSVALMYKVFAELGIQVDYYIPDRYIEGYGVSKQGIEYAADKSISLIIAMDCGIKAFEEIQLASEKGIDFIICDHHLPDENLPAAFTILDPKRKDCAYPYKELCGCGVTFKLAQGLFSKMGIPQEKLYAFLDLVALATTCDIVSLTGENRILVTEGLKKINSNPLPGIKALIEKSGKALPLNVNDIVFGLGPRINAAGRISKAYEALKLLIADDQKEIDEHIEKIEIQNNARKTFEKKIVEEAIEFIEQNPHFENQKSIVLYNPSWHKGVIGIAASRIVDKYFKPTIILTESQGQAVGSARTAGNFNIYNALQSCDTFLDGYGGHRHAAGLAINLDNLESFKIAFESAVGQNITHKDKAPQILIQSQLALEEINEDFWIQLSKMAPFGPANRNPVFLSKNLRDSGYSKKLKEKHLRISLRRDNHYLNAIAFSQGEQYDLVKSEDFDLCYTVEENNWNGKSSLQLMVKDIRKSLVES